MATQFLQTPQSIAIKGRIKTGSSNKLCKRCSRNATRINPKAVPLHPNCRCQVIRGSKI